MSEEMLRKNLACQIKRDLYKYDLAIKNGYRIIYYANASNFYGKYKNINIYGGWYADKEIYDNIDKDNIIEWTKSGREYFYNNYAIPNWDQFLEYLR